MRRFAFVFAVLLLTAALAARAADAPSASPSAVPEAVKKAVDEHVHARMAEGQGVYRVTDELTGEMLELTFEHTGIVGSGEVWSVHAKTYRSPGGDYLACTMFHPAHGPADRRYDLDFRVVPEAGTYVVREVFIHRDGRLVDGSWVYTPRAQPKPQPVPTRSGT